jgi:hypothetical protein
MQFRLLGGGTQVEERRVTMWSEDPGKTPTKTEEPKDEREAERVSTSPRRWFFGFDGWRLDREEDEFVLA